MKSNMFRQTLNRAAVVIIGTIAIITSGCGQGNSVASAERAIVKHYADNGQKVESVSFVGKPQIFDDTWRSPADKGTRFSGNALVVFADNRREEHRFSVFIAEKDGWTRVRGGD